MREGHPAQAQRDEHRQPGREVVRIHERARQPGRAGASAQATRARLPSASWTAISAKSSSTGRSSGVRRHRRRPAASPAASQAAAAMPTSMKATSSGQPRYAPEASGAHTNNA